jgi:hypothetical protein
MMQRAGQVVAVYKKGFFIAACKDSYIAGKLKAIQNNLKEDWCIWASCAAIIIGVRSPLRTGDGDRMNKEAAGGRSEDRIRDAMMKAQAVKQGLEWQLD